MGMLRNLLDELADVVVRCTRAPTRSRRHLRAASCASLAADGRAPRWSSSTPTTRTACSTSPTSTTSCPTWPSATTWACGPAGLLDAARGALGRRRRRRPAAHRAVPPHGRRPARAARSPSPRSGTTVEADGAHPDPRRRPRTPACSCRAGAGWASASAASLPLREGAVRDLRTGDDHHRRARRRRPDPDLHLRRRRRLRHRPLTPARPPTRPKESTMTVLQKKPDEPDRPPDRRGHREHRPRARRDPRRRSSTPAASDDAAYIRKVIDVPAQARARQPRRAAGLDVPAGLARRHRRPVGRQDPREHGDRPQRHARPVGLDARPEDPLDHLGVGQRLARPSSGSTRTTSCTTRTPT